MMENFRELKVYLDILLPTFSEQEVNMAIDYIENHRVMMMMDDEDGELAKSKAG